MVQKGILDTVLEYSDRASRRNTELDTRRLVLLKELELARKNGDKVAEAVAQQKMQVLQRQQNRSGSLDRVFYGFALLMFGIMGVFILLCILAIF